MLTLFLLLVACVAQCTHGELFTASAHLQSALLAEADIAGTMKEYIAEETRRLKVLSSIADNLASHSSAALKNPEYYIANPVNAYLFVKRFTLDWDRSVADDIKGTNVRDLESRISESKAYLPKYEDLNGAVAALLRLQDTYKLDTEKLASGDVAGIRSSELSASDCFEVGRVAYEGEDFYHTSLWMLEALHKQNQEVNKTVDRGEILDYVSFAIYKQGNINHALTLTDELLLLSPDHTRAKNNKKYYLRMLKEKEEAENKRGDTGESPTDTPPKPVNTGREEYKLSQEFLTYEKLCRGETTQIYKDQHKLKCRYRHNRHPLLWLKPGREEEVYLDPYIVFYHQALSDPEMEVIKELATPRLGRATVHNAKTGKLETASYRISKSAWLRDEDDVVIKRVNNRIEAVTGLDMETAEELQIANYGIGGHYEPHFDFARKEEKEAFKSLGTGNRIATWLTYMTDVAAGGATVFPYIGVKIFPEKGGAAFWYNLYKSGEGIYNTRHAACPVLVGTKWVSNKWIHERGQEFRRQCGLRPDE